MANSRWLEFYNIGEDKLEITGKMINHSDWEFDEICDFIEKFSVKNVDLSGNCIESEGLTRLLAMPCIKILNVKDNGIISIDENAFAQSTVIELNISENYFGDSGAIALSKNQTIETLNVSTCGIEEVGASAIAGMKSLCSLDLSTNWIGNSASSFANHPNLFSLKLDTTLVDDESLLPFLNSRLLELSLEQVNISNELREQLEKRIDCNIHSEPLSPEDIESVILVAQFASQVATETKQVALPMEILFKIADYATQNKIDTPRKKNSTLRLLSLFSEKDENKEDEALSPKSHRENRLAG